MIFIQELTAYFHKTQLKLNLKLLIMLNKGKSCKMVAENIEVSLKKAVKIAELPRAEKLID